MALIDFYNRVWGESVDDVTFRKRIQASVLKTAYNVKNETPIDFGQPGHDAYVTRQAWVATVFDDTQEATRLLLPLVMENGVLQTAGNTATDNDIEFVVASVVSAIGSGSA